MRLGLPFVISVNTIVLFYNRPFTIPPTQLIDWTRQPLTLYPLLASQSLIPARLLGRDVNWQSRYYLLDVKCTFGRHPRSCAWAPLKRFSTMLCEISTIWTLCASSTDLKKGGGGERHQYNYLPAHSSYVAALLVVARQYLALSTTYIRVSNFTFALKTAAKYVKTVTVLVYRFQIYKSEYINPNNKKGGKTCLIAFVASTSASYNR